MNIPHCLAALLYFSSRSMVPFSANVISLSLSSNLPHSTPPSPLSADGLTSYFTEKHEKASKSTHSSLHHQTTARSRWARLLSSTYHSHSPSASSQVANLLWGLPFSPSPYFLQRLPFRTKRLGQLSASARAFHSLSVTFLHPPCLNLALKLRLTRLFPSCPNRWTRFGPYLP